MKRFSKTMIAVFAFFLMLTAFLPTQAASNPGTAKKLKLTEYTYYKYWDDHRKSLDKAGYYEGEGYDAVVSWNAAKDAEGYKVTLTWKTEKGKNFDTVVKVKKVNKTQYKFTTTGNGKGAYLIAKSVKSAIRYGYKKQIKSSKLSFNVTGCGEEIVLSKVKIKACKVVKGKKVYGKAVKKEVEPIAMVRDFYVKALNKYIIVKSSGVNIRTKPWAGAGSQVVGAAGKGQRVHVIGQVYNRASGSMADWFCVSWNGSTRYMSKSFAFHDDPTPGPTPGPTPRPVPPKKYMTVKGVSNYLGVRCKKTTDERYEVGRLYNGDKVRVISAANKTYYYVQGLATGVRGYVLARYLR